ncbi:MAG: YceI family protein [Mariprofundaceae bacterium]|nr:YceI family protein [Mariprofundaceae bacterium]
MKNRGLAAALLMTIGLSAGLFSSTAQAEQYDFDIKGQHAFIQFKVKHLGYSWLLGSFRTFDGHFSYDERKPEKNSVSVNIDMASLDTNHAERNKHLRSADFFDVTKYPTATFISTSYEVTGKKTGIVHGKLTLRGISKNIAIKVMQIGTGPDPWGGYRRGFEGHAVLHLSDYKMKKGAMLGALAENIQLFLSIEGVRTKLF